MASELQNRLSGISLNQADGAQPVNSPPADYNSQPMSPGAQYNYNQPVSGITLLHPREDQRGAGRTTGSGVLTAPEMATKPKKAPILTPLASPNEVRQWMLNLNFNAKSV